MTRQQTIDDFLGCERIAFVGVSSKPNDFSRAVFHEFIAHGHDMIPVNPKVTEIDGKTAYGRVQDIPKPVDGVFIMTRPEDAEKVVHDCAEAGIKQVWLHRGAGSGAVSDEAVAFCKSHEMAVVPGECPLMFLDHPAWPHRVHAWGKKVWGTYPN